MNYLDFRFRCANSATRDMPLFTYRSYAAHESLYEAGRAIGRVAEMLRIEATGTLTTRHLDHSVQLCTDESSAEAARCVPACSGDHADDPAGAE